MKRTTTLKMRVSQSELLVIERRAKKRGLKLSAYIRRVAIRHPVAAETFSSVRNTEMACNRIMKLGAGR